MRCAFNDTTPEKMPDNVTIEQLFEFSHAQQVENICYAALLKLGKLGDPVIERKFSQCNEKAIVRAAKQDMELQRLSEVFTANKIRHVPLKGSVLKYLYPCAEWRQSGDIDILVDKSENMDEIMGTCGYVRKDVDNDTTYSYLCGKFHTEVHTRLSRVVQSREFADQVFDYCSPSAEDPYFLKMSDEFMYVYCMVHILSHILSGGGGFKLISDIYLLNKKRELDRNTVCKLADIANVRELMYIAEDLAAKWFDGKTPQYDETKILETYLMSCYVYGTFENYMALSYVSGNRSKDLIRFAFPPFGVMRTQFTYLSKCPLLLPYAWVSRAIRHLRLNKKADNKYTPVFFSAADKVKNKDKRYLAQLKSFREKITDVRSMNK